MGKSSSKNGFVKKFKPWRRGESSKAKGGSSSGVKRSLKNQLRGKERFLAKLLSSDRNNSTSVSSHNDGAVTSDEKTKNLIDSVKLEIESLKNEIQAKQEIERQKKIATKYHQVKFFERQKLTRMESKTRKKLKEAKQAADFDDITNLTSDLEVICMNQLYVAFYPNDKKYISLFGNSERRNDNSTNDDDDERIRKQRIDIKKYILSQIKNGNINQSALAKKSWVNIDVLQARDFDLSLAESTAVFKDHERMTKNRRVVSNDRYIEKSPAALAREEINSSKINDDESQLNSSDEGSSINDDDTVDKLSRFTAVQPENKRNDEKIIDHQDDDDGSTSSSSSSCSDDDDSSSTDNNEDDTNVVKNTAQQEQNREERQDADSEDDFLVDDMEQSNVRDAFAQASREVLSNHDMSNDTRKSDKSKGWQSQKFRHGERRYDIRRKKILSG